ncbi:IS903 transposase [Neochlamydia sp. TUME1]|nr:IS903 transposase [Neochlamydia sp. TUME1]
MQTLGCDKCYFYLTTFSIKEIFYHTNLRRAKKLTYRIRNWSEYNKALVQRGSITLWFSDGTIKGWRENKSLRKEGAPKNLLR